MNNDQEIDILCRMLDALKLDDIVLLYDSDGVLMAEDSDGNKWRGKEFYLFITEECLCFDAIGNLTEGQYVREDLLEQYKKLSSENGVIPGKPEALYPRYLDKNGQEIKPGMMLLMEDGNLELVYETTDAYGSVDLGISATNAAFLEHHPDWEQEFYSLSNFSLSRAVVCPAEEEIRIELKELDSFIQGTELARDYSLPIPREDHERYEAALVRRADLERMLEVNEKAPPDAKDEQKTVPKERRDAR